MLPNGIYLDYNATTPIAPEVLDSMMPYLTNQFGNAASKTHIWGRKAEEATNNSRKIIADTIGASEHEIVFTSGSTEAINTLLKGSISAYRSKGNHIITCETEHKAVLDTCHYLESRLGAEISYIPVEKDGTINIDKYKQAFKATTILAMVMFANNETGVIQPIKELSDVAHANNCLFYSDATQALGKIDFDVTEYGTDALCLSAHKIYGPKGVGAIYMKRRNPRVSVDALIHGGGHERGYRSGTLNVPGIVGLAKACELSKAHLWEYAQLTSSLRTKLEQGLEKLGQVYMNGNIKYRLPNTTNLTIKGININQLISRTPQLAFSTGSACMSAHNEPSHVLKAMGVSDELAKSSIRLSLGKYTTAEEIDQTISYLSNAILSIRNHV